MIDSSADLAVFLNDKLRTDFELVRILKEDADSSVSVFRHIKSGQRFVARRFLGNIDIYQRLLSVCSPFLPKIMEAAESEGQVLVLEEYISGDSLSEMLKDTCFTPRETRRIAMDICRALYVLHSLDIIHRDVKPANIILHDDHAVLLDFDASRSVKEGQAADTISLGTTGYAAPEQYGISQTDKGADIYALGVTMNQMLTGQHPSVSLAKGRMERIISKCTQVHPDKRYHDAVQLMEALIMSSR